jgi:two-component system KDP operon response regulator KdpE
MQDQKLLIIDDDPDLVSLLERAFSGLGAQVHSAPNGREGLRLFYAVRPDLLILDVVMPVMDGWQTLSRIRAFSDVPVIMLSVQNSEQDVVRGLGAGAVDYVTKPFSVRVLVSRAEAVLRRTERAPEGYALYDDGTLRIDVEARRVTLAGRQVAMAGTEFRLLAYLLSHAGQLRTYRQILESVWGRDYRDCVEYVHVYIWRLRKKLAEDHQRPRYLVTVRGLGYRFEPQEPKL